jgi:hypothetical protein
MARTHFFDIEVAELYGINCAVILENIYYWIEHNRANEKNFHDGRYWTFNSTKAFGELFPYLSKKQIETALKKLREEGILITGNYNQLKYDRTLWYAITDKGYSILLRGEMEITSRGNGNDTRVTPIPNINTDVKPSIKERKKGYDEILSEIEDESLRETYLEYIKMRKLIKSPMIDKALTMLISKVEKLAPGNISMQKEMLETAILNNWKSVYPPKNQSTGNNQASKQAISNPFLRAAMQMGDE